MDLRTVFEFHGLQRSITLGNLTKAFISDQIFVGVDALHAKMQTQKANFGRLVCAEKGQNGGRIRVPVLPTLR